MAKPPHPLSDPALDERPRARPDRRLHLVVFIACGLSGALVGASLVLILVVGRC
ncbi:hypothetical protein [Alteraurantiacibacter palmitatis]|uniref:Uncharacterized protein n=1 Tax=Alteraurantiacibacter palmitatis TaxID=2054628 RepID=A0ABV7E6G7_9SPHN